MIKSELTDQQQRIDNTRKQVLLALKGLTVCEAKSVLQMASEGLDNHSVVSYS